jgi:putative transposase
VARELRKWLAKLGTGTLYIEPGSPWKKGYCESFDVKLRDKCLNGEIFYSLKEAKIVIELWRVGYKISRFSSPSTPLSISISKVPASLPTAAGSCSSNSMSDLGSETEWLRAA